MTKVVIIGSSVAGHSVAAGLRERSDSCDITLISEEPCVFYDRRKLFKYLAGEVKEKELFCVPGDFYGQHRINFLKEAKALSINLNRKSVSYRLDDERESVNYELLVICSGAKTQLPEIDGINKEGVFALDGLADVKALRQHLISDTVCVLGFNDYTPALIESFIRKEKEVKLIVPGGAPSFTVPPHCELIDSQVIEIIGESGTQAVKLKGGKIIGVCLAVACGKLQPATSFINDGGIRLDAEAVLVDEKNMTSDPSVYACGTVCKRQDEPWRLKNWDEVVTESKKVVENILGVISRVQV